MRNSKRFRKKDSARSGFTYLENELVSDNGVMVGSDEYDAPPPSNIPLGGEGDVNRGGDFRVDYESTTTPADKDFSVQYITAGGGINFVRGVDEAGSLNPNFGWIYAAGSTAEVNISANPQISAGQQNDIITIQCISNRIVLENCNGLATFAAQPFVMTSGSIISLFYSQTTNLWHETSRTQ